MTTNGIINLNEGRPFFQGAGLAALTGAIGGAFAFGIGEAVSGLKGFLKVAVQTLAHGHLGGVMSVAMGGDYFSGFAAGAVGSAIGHYAKIGLEKAGANNFWKASGTITAGSLSGGVGSFVSGGKFWDGFRNGAISSALNHVAHELTKPKDIIRINSKDKTYTVEYTGEDDIIYLDGKKIMKTERGLLAESLKNNGFSLSYEGPRPMGMGLTDLALEVFGGMELLKGGQYMFSKFFGKSIFTSKLLGYGSKYFGRFHPKYLPDGVKGIFNRGVLRTGWGNNRGIHTFRTSIGNTGRHIDWFYVPK
ncbi:hypothetical protein PL373_06715 [Tenacibaculum maritimum]|nr:hypothetical protein [Tenacibaculum maritimum]